MGHSTTAVRPWAKSEILCLREQDWTGLQRYGAEVMGVLTQSWIMSREVYPKEVRERVQRYQLLETGVGSRQVGIQAPA